MKFAGIQCQNLLNALSDTIALLNSEGQVIYVNHIASGRKKEDVLGTVWLNYLVPEDRPAGERAFNEALTNRKITTLEIRSINLNNEINWQKITFSPIENSEKTEIAVSVTNINQLKLAEDLQVNLKKSLTKSNDLLKTINKINTLLIRKLNMHDLLTEVCRTLIDAGPFQMSWLGWVNEATQQVEPRAIFGDNFNYVNSIKVYADERPEGLGPIGICIRNNEIVVVQDTATSPLMKIWSDKLQKTSWKSSCAIPIKANGRTLATIVAYTEHKNFFGENEISMLESVAANLQIAIENITAKEALIDSKNHLRTIIENEPECVKVVDSFGNLLEMNSAGLAMLEATSVDEVKSHNLINFILPDYHEAFTNLHKQVMSGKSGKLIFEVVGLRGTHRWLETHAAPLKSKKADELNLISVTRDITESKLSEMQLSESSQIWKFALEGAGDGVWNWNISDNTVFFSKQWKAMLGYEENELENNFAAWKTRIHPDDFDTTMAKLQNHFEDKSPYIVEHRLLCKDGSYKWIMARGMVTGRNSEDKPTRMIGTHTDMSKIKTAEQQLLQASKMSSLGELSAGIAHEINNPLAIIAGAANQLTKFAEQPKKLETKIDSIIKASERISKIVNGLKKFSHSSEGQKFERHSLSAIVKEAKNLIEILSRRHDILINFMTEKKSEIICDELEIEQVVINLITNSIDSIKNQKEKWINIEVIDESDAVVLRITDSGPGISESIRHKLFEPFFTTKKIGEGTGLGLSITKGILDRHAATIAVVGDAVNTCFEIKFKLAP